MDKIDKLLSENNALKAELSRERIGFAFVGSAYIKNRLTIPPDLAVASFGKHFEFENGSLVGNHPTTGQRILNGANGAPADFDEALEAIVAAYPHRDRIVRPAGSPSGSAVRTMSRADFEALRPVDQASAVREFRITD